MNQVALRPALTDKFMQTFGAARPAHISLYNSRFTLVNHAGMKRVIDKTSINIIVVGLAGSKTRFLYPGAFDPDEVTPPVCFSLNGKVPENNVTQKQAAQCGVCPHNFFGSATQGKGKNCREYIPLAVILPEETGDEIFLLNVPPGSHRIFTAYMHELKINNVDLCTVVTNMAFSTENQGELILKKMALLPSEWQETIYAIMDSGKPAGVLPVSNVNPEIVHQELLASGSKFAAPILPATYQTYQPAGQLPPPVAPPAQLAAPSPAFLQQAPVAPEAPKRRGPRKKAAAELTAQPSPPAPVQAGLAAAPEPFAINQGQAPMQQQAAAPLAGDPLELPAFLRRSDTPAVAPAPQVPAFGVQQGAPAPPADLEQKLAAAFSLPTS
jgi:hypothetical protein